MLYPDTILTLEQEKKESNLRNMVLETSRFPFIFILPQPTSMGSVGFDPTSTDFQSVAFTRLAYFPCRLWTFTILNPCLFSRQHFIRKMNKYTIHQNSSTLSLDIIHRRMRKRGFEPQMFTTRDLIYSQVQHHRRCRFPKLTSHIIQSANHYSVFYFPTSAVILLKHD